MKRLILASALCLAIFAVPALAMGGNHNNHSDGNCPMMAQGQMMGMMAGQQGQAVNKNLSVEDVKTLMSAKLIMMGNKRLKVGKVTEKDADTILAEIVTIDNSLVHSVEYNRQTGQHRKNF